MPRRIPDARLQTREARRRLAPRGQAYWRSIEHGLHLGYRRLAGKAGTWWARHYLGAQRYAVESLGIADDLSEADGVAILDYWQAQAKARERMASRHAADKASPLTIGEVVRDYLDWLENNRRSAYDARRRVNAFILPRLGNVKVAALTAEMVRKWHAGLAKEPPRMRTPKGAPQKYRDFDPRDAEAVRRRRATANRTLTVLKAALNRAWREGKIESDAAWRRVEPFEQVDAARIRYLTIDEAQRLVNACDTEFRALVQGALLTGARYGELTRLRVNDFNADAGTLTVQQSKSGRPRHIVLTDEGVALFRRLVAGRAADELIFRRNGREWRASEQIRAMAAACRRAKITPPITFHGLRHTWASLSAMNGMPLLIVAKNLGHADTRMVERHYGHLAPSYIADTVRAFAPRLGMPDDGNVVPFRRD